MNRHICEQPEAYAADLCKFLDDSPVNFWAVDTVRHRLEEHGFSELKMEEEWTLTPGDRRYVTKNGSAIFAFIVGQADAARGFNMVAAHSDSPGFRIKPKCEMPFEGGGLKLNTEVYGGPILYTWFDRPLSVAGRVMLRSSDPLHPEIRLLRIDRPILIIPHLAIHFNRAVNEGNKLSKQKDMLPVAAIDGCEASEGFVRLAIADELGVAAEDIIDYDISLYTTQKACCTGYWGNMISSGRLDDLSMVHAGLTALLLKADVPSDYTRVLAIFDNEETGSGTKQGAASPVLEHILRRIVYCKGGSEADFFRAVASSFMISADNAHGFHPNYPEKYDPTNHPVLGGGPCIKVNANCKYMTDAESATVFATLCERAGVPCQYFVNHSDVAGGSTLGNILTSQIPLRGVDMGAPLWAMHSACETGAIADHTASCKAFAELFGL
ncbi:MAG: M18 family aminopeptidase [Muribaculaceae bacterium]|nr:M18 family aminopeptidase [Muribaculaceae bacterium]